MHHPTSASLKLRELWLNQWCPVGDGEILKKEAFILERLLVSNNHYLNEG
jgi:hypothetical protein